MAKDGQHHKEGVKATKPADTRRRAEGSPRSKPRNHDRLVQEARDLRVRQTVEGCGKQCVRLTPVATVVSESLIDALHESAEIVHVVRRS